jgi:hypothetical protein
MFPRLLDAVKQAVESLQQEKHEKHSHAAEGTGAKVATCNTEDLDQHIWHLQLFQSTLKYLAKCLFQDMPLIKRVGSMCNMTVWDSGNAPFNHHQYAKWESDLCSHVDQHPNTAVTGGTNRLAAIVTDCLKVLLPTGTSSTGTLLQESPPHCIHASVDLVSQVQAAVVEGVRQG